ncbi:TIGR01777 family oxidoreductase [Teredinibacter turnerae]|uniref:TIGR01777 family oxidoreductase n=1 Tax=Teredinibacter turnerae TaxID=2426 RepID=UPI00036BFDF7|nr:TIGR01777 family oxidoreductase [Teredinibacter turnerae]
MLPRTIYISGGTGFVGRALCAHILKSAPHISGSESAGVTLYVQTRRPEHHRHRVIKFVKNYQQLPEAVAPDAIINLAGAPIADERWSDKRKQMLLDSRVAATESLLASVETAGHTPDTLLNASAVGFYGPNTTGEIDENAGRGEGFAAGLCASWETAAMGFSRLGTRVCLMRIGVVLGDGGVLAKLLPLFKMGLGGPIGHGKQGMSWIHIDDLCRLFMTALFNPEYTGALNCTAPHPVSQRVFARELGRQLGRPACLPTPASVLRLVYGQMAEELLIGGQFVLPGCVSAAGFKFEYDRLETALKSVLN